MEKAASGYLIYDLDEATSGYLISDLDKLQLLTTQFLPHLLTCCQSFTRCYLQLDPYHPSPHLQLLVEPVLLFVLHVIFLCSRSVRCVFSRMGTSLNCPGRQEATSQREWSESSEPIRKHQSPPQLNASEWIVVN
jgi:hypothetical protein